MKTLSIIISFYNSYPVTSGSSAVTTAFYKSWPSNKKLFMMNHEKKVSKKNIHNFKIKSNNSFVKLICLIPYLIFIYKEIKNSKIKYIIFEGASWTGFIYISYVFFKIFRPNAKFIYHAHNVDFFFRQKNFFISKISFFFEKRILNKIINFDILLHPSYREGRSVSIMQSLQYGIPVIARNIPGNKDLIKNNFNGYLFDTEVEMLNSLKKIYLNNNLRKRLSQNASKIITNNYLKDSINEKIKRFIIQF